jgi:trehalose 6-phosphate phosphatase
MGGDTSGHGDRRYWFVSVNLGPAVGGRVAQLIAPLRDHPDTSAILCDVDGTLAPIVRDPGDATVPEESRQVLRELTRRFALVGFVSGRRAADARRLVGVEEAAYAGNHGLELLTPGAEEASLDPEVADRARAAREFVLELDMAPVGDAGLRLEDKGPIQSLHWRGVADEASAERRARRIADEARRAGLEPRWGRKVLEIRPVGGIDKGTAVRRLLAGRGVDRALFGGDDRTDLDAFRALRSLAAAGDLVAVACIGIASVEAPAELAREADAAVAGPDEFLGVLRALAAPTAPVAGSHAG